jgi:hypothetical protein
VLSSLTNAGVENFEEDGDGVVLFTFLPKMKHTGRIGTTTFSDN